MAVESAKQDVQVSVGKDFVIMGGDRVEVSPDGQNLNKRRTAMATIYKFHSDAENKHCKRVSDMFNAMGLDLVVTQEKRRNGFYMPSTAYIVLTNKPTWLLSEMNLANLGSFEQAHDLGTLSALKSAAFVSVRDSLEEAFDDLAKKIKTTSKHDYIAVESTPSSGEFDLWRYDPKTSMPVKIGAKLTIAKPQL